MFVRLLHNTVYFYDDERHKLPHIHAKYQGQEASFSILDGSILGSPYKSMQVEIFSDI
jgi:hypothetical protein